MERCSGLQPFISASPLVDADCLHAPSSIINQIIKNPACIKQREKNLYFSPFYWAKNSVQATHICTATFVKRILNIIREISTFLPLPLVSSSPTPFEIASPGGTPHSFKNLRSGQSWITRIFILRAWVLQWLPHDQFKKEFVCVKSIIVPLLLFHFSISYKIAITMKSPAHETARDEGDDRSPSLVVPGCADGIFPLFSLPSHFSLLTVYGSWTFTAIYDCGSWGVGFIVCYYQTWCFLSFWEITSSRAS